MLRLCLDVNVWVANYLAIAKGRDRTTAATLLAAACFDGSCRLGPVRPVISHGMLDTLETVLLRLPVTQPFAAMARDQVEAAAGGAIILGGSAANPLRDTEDAAVLNTAMAVPADLLITANLDDFIRGPRARTSTAILSSRAGKPDSLRLDHPRIPGGLVIVSPYAAAAWLIRGALRPPGVLPQCAE